MASLLAARSFLRALVAPHPRFGKFSTFWEHDAIGQDRGAIVRDDSSGRDRGAMLGDDSSGRDRGAIISSQK